MGRTVRTTLKRWARRPRWAVRGPRALLIAFAAFAPLAAAPNAAQAALPEITSVEPSSGPATGGTRVTINGANFTGARGVVRFGRTGTSIGTIAKVESDSKITVQHAPAEVGTVDVRVQTESGESPITPSDRFTYIGGPIWHENAKYVEGVRPVLDWGHLALKTPLGTITCKDVSNETKIKNEARNEVGRGYGESEGFAAADCFDQELEERECGPFLEAGKNICAVFLTAEMPLRYRTQQAVVCKNAALTPEKCGEGELEERSVFTHLSRRTASTPWNGELEYGIDEGEEAIVDRVGVGSGGQSCYPKEKVVMEGHEVERPANFENVPAGCIKLDVVAPLLGIELVYYGTLEPFLVNGQKSGLFPSTLHFSAQTGKLASSEGKEGEALLEGELTTDGARQLELITAE